MDQRFSIVTLGVSDLQRARRFYESGLGWKPSGVSGAQMVAFQMGGCILMLFPTEELAKDANVALPKTPSTASFAIAHNARSEEEVDATLKRAESAGAQILKPAEDVFWGGYSGYFADPDGHAWEVAWNPHWPMDEKGAIRLPK